MILSSYRKTVLKEIQVNNVRYFINKVLPDIDKQKTKQSITANLVHSLDADILHHVIYDIHCNICTIHDCYAVLLCDIDLLKDLLKNSIIKIFLDDQNLSILHKLQSIARDNMIQLGIDPEKGIEIIESKKKRFLRLPVIPNLSEFNIKFIKDSEFFIS